MNNGTAFIIAKHKVIESEVTKFILFIYFHFAVDLKLLIYTKKSLFCLYSNNIELLDINSH